MLVETQRLFGAAPRDSEFNKMRKHLIKFLQTCCADVEAFAQAMETETKPDQDSDSREKEDDEDMSLD